MAEDEQYEADSEPDGPYEEGFEPDDLWQSRAFEQASKMAAKWGDVPAPTVVAMLATLNQEAERKQQLRLKLAEFQHELEMARLKDGERLHELEMAKLKDGERLHEREMAKLKDADRRHKLDMAKLKDGERLHEREMAKLNDADRQHLVGVAAGVVVSLSCIGGAIWFGAAGHYWPMGILVGPVLIVLTKMFVLRRSDTGDVGAIANTFGRRLGLSPAPRADAEGTDVG
ncbi:hypothetical protein ACFVUN_01235 [Kitasatospora griseola]|uniref:hypothetical protein n=1 Tax=Kitasatospora griseola TaxID=2064 RepID=UPI0036DD6F7C